MFNCCAIPGNGIIGVLFINASVALYFSKNKSNSLMLDFAVKIGSL